MDRKYSDPTIWDNSIDHDDEPDGSDGGYTKHGSFIVAPAMRELVRLRAELVGCKRDAERYRWLRRARMNVDVLVREDEDSVWLDMHGWDLDAYVDAALAAKGE